MNNLLASLPSTEYRRLEPRMETIGLAPLEVLCEPDESSGHIYFPQDSVITLLTVLRRATPRAIAVGAVGTEGALSPPILFGATAGAIRAVVQVPGQAVRVPVASLDDAGDFPVLQRALLHHAYAVSLSGMQLAACNAAHQVRQRIIYWLLQMHDRVEGDTFSMTHEHLSSILGIRRPSVTSAARELQLAGWIAYRRGRITVIDRDGLEKAACECYGTLRQRVQLLANGHHAD
jgi:CRP-like cAMP-binding protein